MCYSRCYMAKVDQVSVRELRQNLSVYLRRVKQGEVLEVTERGMPVALLRPLTRRFSTALERMLDEGRLHPASAGHHDLAPPLRLPLKITASQALEEQRRNRI